MTFGSFDFNIYEEEMIGEAWQDLDAGIKVGREIFEDIKVLVSQYCIIFVNVLYAQCDKYGMKIILRH